ncbi:MAG TPA: SDR family NAD(P)-dependent oxidoreductase [Thermoanaerobaculia bacterium]|nr:SDR family NAD(P)-dependent oxidoreductase [Thermoanaerobaculia bacterium]
MSDGRFSGKHALVTGAGRGIGRAIALAFAAEGARVTVLARTPEDLHALESHGGPGSVRARPADVADRSAVDAAVAASVSENGPVDVLVNNAGMFLWKPFVELSPEEWERVIATNLTSAYNLCRAVVPAMTERRSGRIVNVSSIHGLHGDANLTAHCAAKFGLVGFTESLARELRDHNVTVNAVCPGTTDNREPDQARREAPLAQKLRPRDVASAVLWLASDDAAGVTGAAIEVYGGTHIRIQP